MKKWLPTCLVLVLVLVLLVGVVVMIFPASRDLCLALINRENFQEGRPARSWVRDLKDQKAEVRSDAAYALGVIGPPEARDAIPVLGELLQDERLWSASTRPWLCPR